MPAYKTFSLGQIFTEAQLAYLLALWTKNRATFHADASAYIGSIMDSVNRATGQENHAPYLAYMCEYAFGATNANDAKK